ncbi:MAG TPA: HD domain-containing protein [Azospirillum sp.]|nr:HD domain-containing protein [Azospirillum sp.]
MTDTNIVTSALRFAAATYEGSTRPDASPFVTHLSETADLVAKAGGSPEEIAAAWLHDMVEDGHVTIDVIRERFGDAVAALVAGVTDPDDILGAATIQERKAAQAKRLATAPAGSKRIKMAEQISILRALTKERPRSWSLERSIGYVEGTRHVADICREVSPFLNEQFAAAHAAAEKAL